MYTSTEPQTIFKPSADHCKARAHLTLNLRVIRPLLTLLVVRGVFKVAGHPLARTVCRGYRIPPSGLKRVHFFCSRMLLTYQQACQDVARPSVQVRLTRTRCEPLRIVLKSLLYFMVGRRLSFHPKLLVASVLAQASLPDERPFRLVWVVDDQGRASKECVLSSSQPKFHAFSTITLDSCRETERWGRAWCAPPRRCRNQFVSATL